MQCAIVGPAVQNYNSTPPAYVQNNTILTPAAAQSRHKSHQLLRDCGCQQYPLDAHMLAAIGTPCIDPPVFAWHIRLLGTPAACMCLKLWFHTPACEPAAQPCYSCVHCSRVIVLHPTRLPSRCRSVSTAEAPYQPHNGQHKQQQQQQPASSEEEEDHKGKKKEKGKYARASEPAVLFNHTYHLFNIYQTAQASRKNTACCRMQSQVPSTV